MLLYIHRYVSNKLLHLPLNNVVSVTSDDEPGPAEFTADTDMVYIVFSVSPLIVVDVIVVVVVLVVPPEIITLYLVTAAPPLSVGGLHIIAILVLVVDVIIKFSGGSGAGK